MKRSALIKLAIFSSISLTACSQETAQVGDAASKAAETATAAVSEAAGSAADAVTGAVKSAGENLSENVKVTLSSDEQKEGYAMGMAFGQQITAQVDQSPVEFDREMLARALRDTILGNEMALSHEEMAAALTAQRDKITAIAKEKANSAKAEGEKFLSEFAVQEGVQKTESGIMYIVETAGEGKQPSAEDTVKVHYRGTLKDGTEFDSSYAREQPAEFPVGGVIKGWQEILPMMKTGGKWKVAIPSDLAYGERGAGGSIGPNEPLVFEIELLEVK